VGDYFNTVDAQAKLRHDFDGLYELPSDQPALLSDIAATEATVNSYVGKRYAVPVTAADAVVFLKDICTCLFARKAYFRGPGSEIPEKVEKDSEMCIKQLVGISKGEITLGGAVAIPERPNGGADAIIVDGNAPEFKRDQMGGF